MKKDLNQIASSIARLTTGEETTPKPEKNAAAVALGRLGGLKGGKARAESLSAAERKNIAKAAAKIKWDRYYSKNPKKK